MAEAPPFNRIRLSYTAPFSSRVQAEGGFFSGDGGSGQLLQVGPGLQTIEAGVQPPALEFLVPTGARSYKYTIFGFFSAGTVGLSIQGCPDATCAVPVTLFLGTVNFPPNYQGAAIVVSTIPTISTPCPYGTRLQSTAQFVYFLTQGLIDTWLATVGEPLLAVYFTALTYSQFDAQKLCSTGPPPVPELPTDGSTLSLQTIGSLLAVVAWPNLCECVPGTPAPAPFPPPTIALPPGLVQFPITTITTPGDPAALTEILNQLHRVQYTTSQLSDLVFAMQRFKAPFGYRLGRSFAITGTGLIATSARIAGLHWDVTSDISGKVLLPGNPPYVKDLGWISINDANGMLDEHRVSQSHRDWFT